jgi:predicted alpha/beta-hydrolase family hydrolase
MSNAQLVPTSAGDARITWYWADGPRAVLALGHGASTGIEARDLRTLAATLPQRGITVALVEQPWRVAGGMGASNTKTLDTAWRAVWPQLAKPGLPLIAGGRSAGARVACRTARELGADAVLALSFPLHAPGRPDEVWDLEELLGTGLPTLVVQGGYDPFGRPEEFPPTPSSIELVEVPFADHVFAVSRTTGSSQDATLTLITNAVTHWLERLLQPTDPLTCPG